MNTREICSECSYLKVKCLCKNLLKIANHSDIIILQEKSESLHPLNTVKILKLSLLQIKIFQGFDFSIHEEFNLWLNKNLKSSALIYLNSNSVEINNDISLETIRNFIFIDATWKKASQIYHRSKNLHTLPHFHIGHITKTSASYKIRKSPLKNGLSTLQAVSTILNIVEPNLDVQSLDKAFNQLQDFQIDKMGEKTFLKNYRH